jgi:3alpha(or 20beta)-hydroxysteroid dehydrogenase
MAGRLQGRVALITGGARGQGAAEAKLFAQEGAAVAVADVLDEDGRTIAAAAGGSYHHLDVTDEAAWQAVVAEVVAQHGPISVLVNNAGIYFNESILKMDLVDYRRVIDVNQIGVFLGMKTVGAVMSEAGTGSIVNISSVAGIRGAQGSGAYAASKFAVRGMTKVAAREFARFGVRVNSIHPGAIETPMLQQVPGMDGDPGRMLSGIPLRRIAEPEEVARMALFLASDEASYSTGSEFIIDGGGLA